jgi:hypothetical protein
MQEKNHEVLHAFKNDVDVKAHKIVEEMLQFKSSINTMQSDLEAKAQAYADALQKVSMLYQYLSCGKFSYLRGI